MTIYILSNARSTDVLSALSPLLVDAQDRLQEGKYSEAKTLAARAKSPLPKDSPSFSSALCIEAEALIGLASKEETGARGRVEAAKKLATQALTVKGIHQEIQERLEQVLTHPLPESRDRLIAQTVRVQDLFEKAQHFISESNDLFVECSKSFQEFKVGQKRSREFSHLDTRTEKRICLNEESKSRFITDSQTLFEKACELETAAKTHLREALAIAPSNKEIQRTYQELTKQPDPIVRLGQALHTLQPDVQVQFIDPLGSMILTRLLQFGKEAKSLHTNNNTLELLELVEKAEAIGLWGTQLQETNERLQSLLKEEYSKWLHTKCTALIKHAKILPAASNLQKVDLLNQVAETSRKGIALPSSTEEHKAVFTARLAKMLQTLHSIWARLSNDPNYDSLLSVRNAEQAVRELLVVPNSLGEERIHMELASTLDTKSCLLFNLASKTIHNTGNFEESLAILDKAEDGVKEALRQKSIRASTKANLEELMPQIRADRHRIKGIFLYKQSIQNPEQLELLDQAQEELYKALAIQATPAVYKTRARKILATILLEHAKALFELPKTPQLLREAQALLEKALDLPNLETKLQLQLHLNSSDVALALVELQLPENSSPNRPSQTIQKRRLKDD